MNTCCSLNCQYMNYCKQYNTSIDRGQKCEYAELIDKAALARLLKVSNVNCNIVKQAAKKIVKLDGYISPDKLVAVDKDGNKIDYAIYDDDRVITKQEYDLLIKKD